MSLGERVVILIQTSTRGRGRKGILHLYKKEVSLVQLTFGNFANLHFLQLSVFRLAVKHYLLVILSLYFGLKSRVVMFKIKYFKPTTVAN